MVLSENFCDVLFDALSNYCIKVDRASSDLILSFMGRVPLFEDEIQLVNLSVIATERDEIWKMGGSIRTRDKPKYVLIFVYLRDKPEALLTSEKRG